MMTNADPYILFDCTRLLLRALNQTPTGIDRVEMAYARHLQANHASRTRYLVSFGGRPKIMPTPAVRRFLSATSAVWSSASAETSVKQIRKISAFLGLPESILADGSVREAVHAARLARRRMAGANMVLHSLLGQLRPRNLWGFSRQNRPSLYLNVSHENIDSAHVSRWLQAGGSSASTFLVHDLIPITHPEYVRPNDPARHERRLKTVMRNASSIIVNSDYTKSVLQDYLGSQSRKIPSILTAPLGIEDIFLKRPLDDLAVVAPYFVCVGTIEPRKNHTLLLQIWRRLVEEMGEAAPKLVLIGKRGWENENAVDLIERSRDIQSHVIECSGLSDKVLARLIMHARATLFPSHVEGYGLPVVESLALGTPAICSNIEATREIANGMVELLDPLDGLGWKQAILEYSHPEQVRWRSGRVRLRGYQPPRWEDHFRLFDQLIDNAPANQLAV